MKHFQQLSKSSCADNHNSPPWRRRISYLKVLNGLQPSWTGPQDYVVVGNIGSDKNPKNLYSFLVFLLLLLFDTFFLSIWHLVKEDCQDNGTHYVTCVKLISASLVYRFCASRMTFLNKNLIENSLCRPHKNVYRRFGVGMSAGFSWLVLSAPWRNIPPTGHGPYSAVVAGVFLFKKEVVVNILWTVALIHWHYVK
jgi:hypothetical protein